MRRSVIVSAAAAVLASLALLWSEDCGSPIGLQSLTLASVRVSPALVTLHPNSLQLFVASCHAAGGTAVPCPDLTWSVTGGTRQPTAGTPDTAGVFTALSTPGTGTVTATTGALSGSATVNIVPVVSSGNGNINLNLGQSFQTWAGWQAVLAGGPAFDAIANTPFEATLQNLVVNDIGITRFQSGANNQLMEAAVDPRTHMLISGNDDANPFHINVAGFTFGPYIETGGYANPGRDARFARGIPRLKPLVEANGEPFTWVFSEGGLADYQNKNPDEFGEFHWYVLDHWKKTFGLEPDIFNVVNEPDNVGAVQAGLSVNGTVLGRNALTTILRMRANGLNKVMLSIPEVEISSDATTYFNDAITNNPGLLPYVAELGYHRYVNPTTTGTLQAIDGIRTQYGIRVGMGEHIGSSYQDLYQDLTVANASFWEMYVAYASGTDTGGRLINFDPVNRTWSYGVNTSYLRQYMHYIRPNAVRKGCSSTNGALFPVAFQNPNGKLVVVLYSTGGGVQPVNVDGLPAGTYQVSWSTAAEPRQPGPQMTLSAGEVLSTAMPAAGTLTVSQQ